jgi:hypothetical protein
MEVPFTSASGARQVNGELVRCNNNRKSKSLPHMKLPKALQLPNMRSPFAIKFGNGQPRCNDPNFPYKGESSSLSLSPPSRTRKSLSRLSGMLDEGSNSTRTSILDAEDDDEDDEDSSSNDDLPFAQRRPCKTRSLTMLPKPYNRV